MGCDMCGADKQLFLTIVEGVEMNLCDSCTVYGEVRKRIPSQKEGEKEARAQGRRPVPRPRPLDAVSPGARRNGTEEGDAIEIIVADYGQRIRQARERLGLKQEELAKRLAIKESQLHKYESGIHKPDIITAQLLERTLKIRLVESYVESYVEKHTHGKAGESSQLTIGDLLKK